VSCLTELCVGLFGQVLYSFGNAAVMLLHGEHFHSVGKGR